MKIVIVGAGAAGCVAAINYKRNHIDDDVLIIEHANKPLKKLLATGNGRCNLGNDNLDINKYKNPGFADEILKNYSYKELFNSIHIKTKSISELAYPISESAVSVCNAFLKEINRLNIEIHLEEKLIDYIVANKIKVITDKSEYIVDKLFLATSLKSSPKLGSDGSILKILEKHNYKIITPLPGLCPIHTLENTKDLDGVRIKCNVKLGDKNKIVYSESGEVLFKDKGLSGIVIFNISSLIARNNKTTKRIILDVLPDYSELELREYANKYGIDNFLQAFLHPKFHKYLKNRYKNKDEIIANIKKLEFNFKDFYGFDFSQVSVGGVSLDEIDNHLMSKKEKNIYLLGELVDEDGPCGGYNLSWAFASALKATNKF